MGGGAAGVFCNGSEFSCEQSDESPLTLCSDAAKICVALTAPLLPDSLVCVVSGIHTPHTLLVLLTVRTLSAAGVLTLLLLLSLQLLLLLLLQLLHVSRQYSSLLLCSLKCVRVFACAWVCG